MRRRLLWAAALAYSLLHFAMTGVRQRDDVKIDLFDHGSFVPSVPHHMFDWLRANAPVYWHAIPRDAAPEGYRPGFWVLTKYDDVMEASRAWHTYSSARGASRSAPLPVVARRDEQDQHRTSAVVGFRRAPGADCRAWRIRHRATGRAQQRRARGLRSNDW